LFSFSSLLVFQSIVLFVVIFCHLGFEHHLLTSGECLFFLLSLILHPIRDVLGWLQATSAYPTHLPRIASLLHIMHMENLFRNECRDLHCFVPLLSVSLFFLFFSFLANTTSGATCSDDPASITGTTDFVAGCIGTSLTLAHQAAYARNLCPHTLVA
jgi:hypothetical protein